ncbi:hypothetical protein SDC9_70072 [bioreactor metagenome]|uniref:Uncharacterized protein n=1 Tax=bioreactor metagenome TaxID=1076179 RepID=A0A644Y6N0_9ZZZZ
MAVLRSPFASYAHEGLTTVRPVACMYRLSRQFECSAPAPKEEPMALLTTSGSLNSGPCIYLHLPTQWNSSLNATSEKSAYINSTHGLSPVTAAPMALPIMAVSTIGVFFTLSDPNSSRIPFVIPKIFPICATSSPYKITLSSLRISSFIASPIACP